MPDNKVAKEKALEAIKHENFSEHKWEEEYYGYKCECGAFIPYGCEPWMPTDEELHEMILNSKSLL